MTSFHERLAAAATPGPWLTSACYLQNNPQGFLRGRGREHRRPWGQGWKDAACIAACPPEMVQAWENVVKAARLHVCVEAGDPCGLDCDLNASLDAYDAQVAALQKEKP